MPEGVTAASAQKAISTRTHQEIRRELADLVHHGIAEAMVDRLAPDSVAPAGAAAEPASTTPPLELKLLGFSDIPYDPQKPLKAQLTTSDPSFGSFVSIFQKTNPELNPNNYTKQVLNQKLPSAHIQRLFSLIYYHNYKTVRKEDLPKIDGKFHESDPKVLIDARPAIPQISQEIQRQITLCLSALLAGNEQVEAFNGLTKHINSGLIFLPHNPCHLNFSSQAGGIYGYYSLPLHSLIVLYKCKKFQSEEGLQCLSAQIQGYLEKHLAQDLHLANRTPLFVLKMMLQNILFTAYRVCMAMPEVECEKVRTALVNTYFNQIEPVFLAIVKKAVHSLVPIDKFSDTTAPYSPTINLTKNFLSKPYLPGVPSLEEQGEILKSCLSTATKVMLPFKANLTHPLLSKCLQMMEPNQRFVEFMAKKFIHPSSLDRTEGIHLFCSLCEFINLDVHGDECLAYLIKNLRVFAQTIQCTPLYPELKGRETFQSPMVLRKLIELGGSPAGIRNPICLNLAIYNTVKTYNRVALSRLSYSELLRATHDILLSILNVYQALPKTLEGGAKLVTQNLYRVYQNTLRSVLHREISTHLKRQTPEFLRDDPLTTIPPGCTDSINSLLRMLIELTQTHVSQTPPEALPLSPYDLVVVPQVSYTPQAASGAGAGAAGAEERPRATDTVGRTKSQEKYQGYLLGPRGSITYLYG